MLFVVQVCHRIFKKRINVRIEHVAPSRCREDFLRRVKANDSAKHEAKLKNGEPLASNLDSIDPVMSGLLCRPLLSGFQGQQLICLGLAS